MSEKLKLIWFKDKLLICDEYPDTDKDFIYPTHTYNRRTKKHDSLNEVAFFHYYDESERKEGFGICDFDESSTDTKKFDIANRAQSLIKFIAKKNFNEHGIEKLIGKTRYTNSETKVEYGIYYYLNRNSELYKAKIGYDRKTNTTDIEYKKLTDDTVSMNLNLNDDLKLIVLDSTDFYSKYKHDAPFIIQNISNNEYYMSTLETGKIEYVFNIMYRKEIQFYTSDYTWTVVKKNKLTDFYWRDIHIIATKNKESRDLPSIILYSIDFSNNSFNYIKEYNLPVRYNHHAIEYIHPKYTGGVNNANIEFDIKFKINKFLYHGSIDLNMTPVSHKIDPNDNHINAIADGKHLDKITNFSQLIGLNIKIDTGDYKRNRGDKLYITIKSQGIKNRRNVLVNQVPKKTYDFEFTEKDFRIVRNNSNWSEESLSKYFYREVLPDIKYTKKNKWCRNSKISFINSDTGPKSDYSEDEILINKKYLSKEIQAKIYNYDKNAKKINIRNKTNWIERIDFKKDTIEFKDTYTENLNVDERRVISSYTNLIGEDKKSARIKIKNNTNNTKNPYTDVTKPINPIFYTNKESIRVYNDYEDDFSSVYHDINARDDYELRELIAKKKKSVILGSNAYGISS